MPIAADKDEPKRMKYGNEEVTVDGKRFRSQLEFKRWKSLCLAQKAGEISELVCEPVYEMVVNNELICKFLPDFRYKDKTGAIVIEDTKCKSTITPVYKLKKRLLKALYGLSIIEVYTD